MQTDSYKTAYPKFSNLAFSNTPAGTRAEKIAHLFDQIKTLVAEGGFTPEVGHVIQGELMGAWGSIYVGLNGKVNN